MLLLFPSVVAACPIPFRSVGPVKLTRQDVVRPVQQSSSRRAWGLDQSWKSTSPELNQLLVARGGRTYVSATFTRQDTLSIDAAAPDSTWRYSDDGDPATPSCELEGQSEWERPVILIREEERRVRVAAVVRRTTGDRTGCVLGADQDASDWGCPVLTRKLMKLKRPVGHRQLVFERLG